MWCRMTGCSAWWGGYAVPYKRPASLAGKPSSEVLRYPRPLNPRPYLPKQWQGGLAALPPSLLIQGKLF